MISHNAISISSGPIVSLNVTALPMSSSYTNEFPNDSPSGSTQDDLGREGRTKDIGEIDTCVSYDKRLKDHSKAYLLKYTKTSDIRCISRQINQFMMEYNSRFHLSINFRLKSLIVCIKCLILYPFFIFMFQFYSEFGYPILRQLRSI